MEMFEHRLLVIGVPRSLCTRPDSEAASQCGDARRRRPRSNAQRARAGERAGFRGHQRWPRVYVGAVKERRMERIFPLAPLVAIAIPLAGAMAQAISPTPVFQGDA